MTRLAPRSPLATLLPASTGTWAARCSHTGSPETWFPTSVQALDAARFECGRCPLATSCLAYGVTAKMSGVWGGRLLAHGHERHMSGDRAYTNNGR